MAQDGGGQFEVETDGVVDASDNGQASVIAVENAAPEVIHVMSMASTSGGTNNLIYTIPSLQGAQIISPGATMSGMQTFTLSGSNMAFPLQHMVSHTIHSSFDNHGSNSLS
jgi:hypothetical protein